jgi:hypothetical protein
MLNNGIAGDAGVQTFRPHGEADGSAMRVARPLWRADLRRMWDGCERAPVLASH